MDTQKAPGSATQEAPRRAALYARFSSNKQREASIDDQFRSLQARAEREGWRVVAKFADKAITGSRADRPQYQAMLAAAKRKDFDVLLIESLDRLSRDLVEQEKTLRRMEHDGLRIIGLNDGYDTTSKNRKMMRAVYGAKNEEYSAELGERTHRGQTGQAEKGFLAGGKPYGYDLTPVMSKTERDQYGNPERIGTHLRPNSKQAPIVREIFERFAAGESERAIAGVLNARKVPSPGAKWDRADKGRLRAWQGSAIQVMLGNSTYNGRLVWNRSHWVRDPDTKVRKRFERPRSEWNVHEDEAMRIVSAALWEKVQRRFELRKGTRSGGAGPGRGQKGVRSQGPKFTLSGLLRCGVCRAHYIIAGKDSYACSMNLGGGSEACKNDMRINRLVAEHVLLDEMRKRLLSPAMVAQMAEELRAEYDARLKAKAKSGTTVPKELTELDKRLERLQRRLKNGDPDLSPEDIAAAIRRAEQERLSMLHDKAQGRSGKAGAAKLYAALPNVARMYERKIERGLSGKNPEHVAEARQVLREMLGGKIVLRPTPKGLVARSTLHRNVLLSELKPDGSGGRI